jgi:hypothetical protein
MIFGKGKEMKKRYVTILVFAIGAILVLTALPSGAEEEKAEKKEESVWHEIEPRGGRGGFRLTDEMIEHMMSRLAETNPAKAKELAKLREKDPEKFKAELREVMRERFGRRLGEHERGGGKYKKRGPERGMEFGRGGGPSFQWRKGKRGPAFGRRPHPFVKWLEENYPEIAKELAELEEKSPELYGKRRALCYRRYRTIYEAKENPKLVEILKEDLDLKDRRDKLLEEIRAGVSENEKKELVKELADVLGQRFDLIVKRKQIEYERLLERLKELQERVKANEAQVAKWKKAEFKEMSVQGRVEELVGKVEKFRWE